MEERQVKSESEKMAAESAPHHLDRSSILRRITPHLFNTTPHPEGTTVSPPAERDGTHTPGGRIAGLKRHVSYQKPALPHLHSNVDFPEEILVTHENKLADFRRLVGVDNSPSFLTSSGYSRAGENIGIYAHVVQEEAACQAKYTRYALLINASLGLQLIFAAAVTAVAAGDGPRSGLVGLGALNTVLAGFLTFTKGSGLPNREKYYAGEWTKIRDHIEQREREFGRSDCPLDVDTEVRHIEAMFRDVKQDVEANTPDGFTSVATKRFPGLAGHQSSTSDTLSPGSLEAGYGRASPRPANSVMLSQQQYQKQSQVSPQLQPQQEQHGLPNIFEKLNSSVDPSSRTSQVLSKLSSLQAKYGDTIMEKLHHLEHNESTTKDSQPAGETGRNIDRSIRDTISTGQNQTREHINEVSSLVNNEAAYLATAGVHAQVAGEAAARDLAERAATAGRGTASHVQDEASRVAGQAHAEADKLVHVGQQAESAARNISAGISNEIRGFFDHSGLGKSG